jgi:hypothetical protein
LLVSVFGVPSPLAQWGNHLIRAMLDVAVGEYRDINACTFEELRTTWRTGSSPHAAFFADAPDALIVRTFLNSGACILGFAEEPSDIVGFAMLERGIDIRSAIRLAALSFSTLHDLFLADGILLVRRGSRPMSVRGLLRHIAEFYELSLSPEQVEGVVSRLSAAHDISAEATIDELIARSVPLAKPVGYWAAHAPAVDRELARVVLKPYARLLDRQPLTTATWPRELFLSADQPGVPLSGPIDMTGPARYLVYGPYMHVARGQWIATLRFAIADNRSGNALVLDVYCGEVLCVGRVDLPESGIYTVDLPFEIEEPRLALEVRVAMDRGAIEGWFDLRQVELNRVC